MAYIQICPQLGKQRDFYRLTSDLPFPKKDEKLSPPFFLYKDGKQVPTRGVPFREPGDYRVCFTLQFDQNVSTIIQFGVAETAMTVVNSIWEKLKFDHGWRCTQFIHIFEPIQVDAFTIECDKPCRLVNGSITVETS